MINERKKSHFDAQRIQKLFGPIRNNSIIGLNQGMDQNFFHTHCIDLKRRTAVFQLTFSA